MSKFQEYPLMVYSEGKHPITVHSEDELKALGKGWVKEPVSVPVEDHSKIGLRPVVHATAKYGADPKRGADPVKGVK